MSTPKDAPYKKAQRVAKAAWKRSRRGYPPRVEKAVDGSGLIAVYPSGAQYFFSPYNVRVRGKDGKMEQRMAHGGYRRIK